MARSAASSIFDDLMRFKPEGLSPNAWAVLAGVSRTVWADMRRHGNPSRRTLEKLLGAAGSSLAEFEALRVSGEPAAEARPAASRLAAPSPPQWRAPQAPPLPLLATSAAGHWGDAEDGIEQLSVHVGQIAERLARPASLAQDASAYALTVAGDSMWPRFRRGQHIAVSASASVAIGDDVAVKLKDSGAGAPPTNATLVLVKQLTAKSKRGIRLRQYNPDVSFDVAAEAIAAIDKVIGELI